MQSEDWRFHAIRTGRSNSDVNAPLECPPAAKGRVRQTHRIGSDVWVGGGVIILPSVRIGSQAVIGAGSMLGL
ncbi:hypothetical protein [Nitrobacter sp. JJSN]|uniref:hypothetical protein n=1 Tax=Nitrobacter sp. JJSN TaxID=3453033 RepID=UPI003F75C9EA